jgi:condensin-2 complex subunit D3
MNCRGNADTIVKKRMHIYECLLKQMAPEHILATSAKLCADILASAADGILDLSDSPVQCVLEVLLTSLTSKAL